MHQSEIDLAEWKWLLAGGTYVPDDLPNPSPDWISDRSWGDILMLAALVGDLLALFFCLSLFSFFSQHFRNLREILSPIYKILKKYLILLSLTEKIFPRRGMINLMTFNN